MKAAVWSLFYAVVGALFLCVGVLQNAAFFLLVGACFLLLAAWEAWTSMKRKKEPAGWRLSMSLAFLLIAACYVYQGVMEPTGDNVGMAVVWALLGAAYIAKALWKLYTARAGTNKEEEP